jgi:hypothetical protein
MANIQFGPKPARLTVKIAEDADFGQYVRIPPVDGKGRPPDPWPADQAIELRWGKVNGDPPTVWTAEIDPDDDHLMGWNIDKAEVKPGRPAVPHQTSSSIGVLSQGKRTIQDVT